METPLRVLIVGCGHMGTSHARAYQCSSSFEICGVVSRGAESRGRLSRELGCCPEFSDYTEALASTRPDAVCISTYPETHAPYSIQALQAGCHVFLEKPLAVTADEAELVLRLAGERKRKLVVGYILQQHPTWNLFVEEARKLGKPLVMRMNLNQQSSGPEWQTHKNIMNSLSPIVDCGVHYVEVMCRMTSARPVRVQAIGARLSNDLTPGNYNYGQLQVVFEDGSVGWYEAGWGPMVSQTAFFVKDVFGPKGSVSIGATAKTLESSSDVNSHTKTDSLILHSALLNHEGTFVHEDRCISASNEPNHDALCALEQDYFLRAIREDLDLSEHWESARQSLKIVLAADQSIRENRSVVLS